ERRLYHEPAKDRWGLAAADVVANVTFHEADSDGGDRALISQFADPIGFRTFDAFGGHEVRRARVAERDGDLPLALSRWALWRPGNREERDEQEGAVARLSALLFADPDPYAPRVALEAAIERLRQGAASPQALGAALALVEAGMGTLEAGAS